MMPAFGLSAGLVPSVSTPPPRFRPLGNVTHVALLERGYVRSQGVTEAQKAGLRYEAQIQTALLAKLSNYRAGPVMTCLDDGKMRSLVPDGLLIYLDRVFVFEIKYQHMPEAWWQLEKLYKRCAEILFNRPISLVEVCRTYDPATPFPCSVTLVKDLDAWCSRSREEFGVWECRRP